MMKVCPYNKKIILGESDLTAFDPACPFCRSTDRLSIGRLQDDPEILLLDCRECHARSASRIPTSGALTEYYRDYHNSPFSSHGKQVTFDLPARLANHIYRKTSGCGGKNCVNILDFGGGDGSISIKVAEKFLGETVPRAHVMVIDYDYDLVSPQDKRISIKHTTTLDDLDIKDKEYHIVIASASIEHVPDPREVMIKLLELMRPRGIFYARTPYMVPFFKVFSSLGLEFDLTYPAHIHDLGVHFWNGIFKKLSPNRTFEILASQPSIVETSLKDHFFRTLAANVCKTPWYVLGNRYRFVGGWEVFAMKERIR